MVAWEREMADAPLGTPGQEDTLDASEEGRDLRERLGEPPMPRRAFVWRRLKQAAAAAAAVAERMATAAAALLEEQRALVAEVQEMLRCGAPALAPALAAVEAAQCQPDPDRRTSREEEEARQAAKAAKHLDAKFRRLLGALWVQLLGPMGEALDSVSGSDWSD
eukprot:scaffold12.g7950.t1